LFDRAQPGDRYIHNLGLTHVIREDASDVRYGWFPAFRDVREYWRVRPWETAYRSLGFAYVPVVVTEDWPTRADAPALRELLGDRAPFIRALAVEALGALGLPDDIRRIGALLTDMSKAAPGLARARQRSSTSEFRSIDEDALIPLVWSDRTVSAYARAAVLLMTGRRFDAKPLDEDGFSFGSGDDVSFLEWIEMRDLGAESLWYWQQRLIRERYDYHRPGLNPSPAEVAAYRAGLQKRFASDLDRLSPDAQAKVFLCTNAANGYPASGPVNPFFPDGFTLRIGRARILELIDGRNIWSDCLDLPDPKRVLLWRLARLAPALLPERDWPRVREALRTRAPSWAETAVLLSRLQTAGERGQAARPQVREGQDRPAAQPESASHVAARQGIRERLARAVAGSRELFERASLAGTDGRFSPLRDVREYWRLRPWDPAYKWGVSEYVSLLATEGWPTRGDAPVLRDLLNDPDPAIRGLAVEALGAVGLPEDIRRIGTLLTDIAAAAPALAPISHRGGSRPTPPLGDGDLFPLVWTDRTVGAYARAAVQLMTGHDFAGTSARPSFAQWIETHDLGWDSLWYWDRRLVREQLAAVGNEATERYRAERRKQTIEDLGRLSADAQAKVYLLTSSSNEWDAVTGPVNPLFPEGFTLGIRRARILELVDGCDTWRDCNSHTERVLLWRLGRLAPTLLPTRDWPHVRDQLQKRVPYQAGMPVLVSRLLPAARAGQADDPRTRDGFLRTSLARAINDRRLQFIAEEMVRTNVNVQWSFLATRFNDDPAVGARERQGVLKALAEAPHTREKLVALVAFVDDPRNAALLTQREVPALMDSTSLSLSSNIQIIEVEMVLPTMANLPRQHVADALNAFSKVSRGRDYVPRQVVRDLMSGSQAALIELRRLAHEVLAQMRNDVR
jgi:hypothetical protein